MVSLKQHCCSRVLALLKHIILGGKKWWCNDLKLFAEPTTESSYRATSKQTVQTNCFHSTVGRALLYAASIEILNTRVAELHPLMWTFKSGSDVWGSGSILMMEPVEGSFLYN